jgi:hypothetical protein
MDPEALRFSIKAILEYHTGSPILPLNPNEIEAIKECFKTWEAWLALREELLARGSRDNVSLMDRLVKDRLTPKLTEREALKDLIITLSRFTQDIGLKYHLEEQAKRLES